MDPIKYILPWIRKALKKNAGTRDWVHVLLSNIEETVSHWHHNSIGTNVRQSALFFFYSLKSSGLCPCILIISPHFSFQPQFRIVLGAYICNGGFEGTWTRLLKLITQTINSSFNFRIVKMMLDWVPLVPNKQDYKTWK